MNDMEQILQGLVRIGIVTDRDTSGKKVRVYYHDCGLSSGWLYCVQRADEWVPAVNQTVIVLYLPIWNGDGFVIGGIG